MSWNTLLKVTAPTVGEILTALRAFVRNDALLRLIQAENAASCVRFEQGTLTAGQVYLVEIAQAGENKYCNMSVFTDATSGTGRFRIDGGLPTAAGVGNPVATGGDVINVEGLTNIKQFRLTPETGQTLNYTVNLFR